MERARPDEIEVTERMRYACAVDMGWVPPAGTADDRERDEDDERAIVLVCRDGAEIVGCMRVVPPVAGRLLPTERAFGVRVSPPGSAADVGRLVVAPSRRGLGGPIVMAGLYARAWLEVRALGLGRVLAASPAHVIELHRALGVDVTELGPPQRHWGEEMIPLEATAGETGLAVVASPEPGDPREAEQAFTRRRLLMGGAAAPAGCWWLGCPSSPRSARRLGRWSRDPPTSARSA